MGYRPTISSDYVQLRTGTVGASYDVSPQALDMRGWNQCVLFFNLVLDGTDCLIKIEAASPVGTGQPAAGDWHQITYLDTSAAVAATGVETVPVRTLILQYLATSLYAFPMPVNYKFIRVSAKRTGGTAATTLTVNASQGLV